MKKHAILVLLATVLPAAAQTVFLEVSGVVETSSTATFAAGRPYSFRFSYDLAATASLSFADVARYDGAAADIVFNYDAGAYVGTASGLSIWTQNSASGDGFAVGLPFAGGVHFDPVDGHSIYNGAGSPLLDLVDPSGGTLSSTALLNLAAGVPQFLAGGDDRLRLRWGASGDEVVVVATIDRIVPFTPQAIPEPWFAAALIGAGALLYAVHRRFLA